jgi:5S rRNA maturation endonuclease (ribonuclease M5)
MSEVLRQHIIQQLSLMPTAKRINERSAMIVCPFHPDKNPSGSVNLDPLKSIPLGWFRCFACNKSVKFNDLALQAGLQPIGDEHRENSDSYLDPSKFRDRLLDEEPEDQETTWTDEYEDIEFKDFDFRTWRGVPTKFLAKIGARLGQLALSPTFTVTFVWLPVFIGGELKGYVKAEIEKPKDKSKPSYWNAPGLWSRDYGLLYFDYSVKLMKRQNLRSLVLCEGPRDSLRLLQAGIPAMSVLGAKNWYEGKRFQLERAKPERLILMMDGDKAGREATRHILKDVRHHFDTKYVALWKREPGSDPFNCSPAMVERVRAMLV